MLILNSIGQHIENDIMRWTCSDPADLPVECENLEIPHGSICKMIKDKAITYYVYDSVAKEWFIKEEAAGGGGFSDEALDDIKKDLEAVFQSLSSSKAKIARAITEKGNDTLANDTFDKMAQNILDIITGDENVTTFAQVLRVLIERNSELQNKILSSTTDEEKIQILTDYIPILKSVVSTLEYSNFLDPIIKGIKSSCAVKLLEDVGIQEIKNYVSKLELKDFLKQDNFSDTCDIQLL